jgi:hypothetical protein
MAITKIQSESLNLADTYAFTGTVTGAGGVNTPSFKAFLSGSDQTLTSGANNKIAFNSESYDSDNSFDSSSTYRFTPLTAGKYFIYSQIAFSNSSSNEINAAVNLIMKNGSEILRNTLDPHDSYRHNTSYNYVAGVFSMNGSSDYIEVYGQPHMSGGTGVASNGENQTFFGAYKIIE